MTSGAKTYFDQSAGRYAERSASFLWRLQRNRELTAVQALLGDVRGLNVLDLGCGAGFYTRHCLEQGARGVIAVDFSPRMVEQLPKDRVTAMVADAAELRLDQPAEKIICAGLLEFVPDPLAVLTNARHLVTPQGLMVCLVPPDNLAGRIYRSFHCGNGISISLFSKPSFAEMADIAGWRVDAYRFIFPFSTLYRLKVKGQS